MNDKKLDGLSMDLEAANRAKLAAVFPECFAEGKLDLEKLLALCGNYTADDFEKYEFRWKGKADCLKLAQKRSAATLRPCREESVNFDTTQNLYLEGDNLEVLKLLQTAYYRQVKMIYIDPPYNTGHDFVYADDFSDPLAKYKEVTQQATRSNPETMGRYHTNWLNMMYPRLKLASNLLRDDGVIFISIDDNEVDNLKKLCNEVFGEENFVALISWQRTYSIRNDSQGIPAETEYILCYCKQSPWNPKKLSRTEKMDAAYKNPDGDRCAWMSGSPVASEASTHQGMVYAIQSPFTGEMIYPSDTAHWRYGQEQMLEYMNGWCPYELRDLNDAEKRAQICGVAVSNIRQDVKGIVLAEPLAISKEKAQKIYDKGPWPRFYFTNGGLGGIRRKVYADAVEGRISTNFWPYEEVGHTDEAKKEIKSLFDNSAPFDTPKPVRLLERIIDIACEKDSLVLDFFSGSATTAHAIMKKNMEDGGTRKYILVQLPECIENGKYINLCEIGKERIRRAGKLLTDARKAKEEDSLFNAETPALDVGFKVFKLDSSNLKLWDGSPLEQDDLLTLSERLNDMIDRVKPERSDEDVIAEIMLKMGVPLTEPVTKLDFEGHTVYSAGRDNLLLICLQDKLSTEDLEKMADFAPGTIILSESALADDSAMSNAHYILKNRSIELKLI